MPNPLLDRTRPIALRQIPTPASRAPRVALRQLDALWFQVTGTLCNLRSTHCFISYAPDNHSFGFLDYVTVTRTLEAS